VTAALTSFATTFGAIAWNPEIRNILSVLVGVVVLFGSVYLLVGSNVGLRSGLLITLTGLFGWMATMGVIWWIYGIGMKGADPAWHVEEVNYSGQDYAGLEEATLARAHDLTALADLPTAQDLLEANEGLAEEILPPELFEPGSEDELEARLANVTIGQVIEAEPGLAEQFDDALGGWELLPVSDRQRGDASASADAFLGPDGRGLFDTSSEYLLRDVFSVGGKPKLPDDPTRWDRITNEIRNTVEFQHPTHYAVVQIQPVVPVETVPGEAPPPPELDDEAPIISVVMVRNLGDKRFPAAMTTLFSTLLFALFAWMLHRRDARIAEARAA
jgi:hypothetical protein